MNVIHQQKSPAAAPAVPAFHPPLRRPLVVVGYLCESIVEMAACVQRLARDEPARMRTIVAARAAVERLAEPISLWDQWQEALQ